MENHRCYLREATRDVSTLAILSICWQSMAIMSRLSWQSCAIPWKSCRWTGTNEKQGHGLDFHVWKLSLLVWVLCLYICFFINVWLHCTITTLFLQLTFWSLSIFDWLIIWIFFLLWLIYIFKPDMLTSKLQNLINSNEFFSFLLSAICESPWWRI